MRIMYWVIKVNLVIVAGLLAVQIAQAQPTATAAMLEGYRASYHGSPNIVKYIFVDANGKNHTDDGPGKIYLLDISAKGPSKFIYFSEIDHLFKGHFEVMVDDTSLISAPESDYLVLQMSRPREYNPKYRPCAGGMGEDRAYLIAIANDKVKIINRNFFSCSGSYKVLRENGRLGYEINGQQSSASPSQPIFYLLKDGKLDVSKAGKSTTIP